ncbi:MAG: hypothetical protein QG618_197 [Thermodesulfobacteriota bacterium]|nr:hypothetical protein [Thermodesulfobacteriota bacterium]
MKIDLKTCCMLYGKDEACADEQPKENKYVAGS